MSRCGGCRRCTIGATSSRVCSRPTGRPSCASPTDRAPRRSRARWPVAATRSRCCTRTSRPRRGPTRGAGRRPAASSSSAGGSPRSRRFPTWPPRSSSTTRTRRCRKNGCRRGTPATCCWSGPGGPVRGGPSCRPRRRPKPKRSSTSHRTRRRPTSRSRAGRVWSSSIAASSRPARGCSPSRSPTRSAPRAGSRCASSTGGAASGCSRATRVTSSCAGTATPSDR